MSLLVPTRVRAQANRVPRRRPKQECPAYTACCAADYCVDARTDWRLRFAHGAPLRIRSPPARQRAPVVRRAQHAPRGPRGSSSGTWREPEARFCCGYARMDRCWLGARGVQLQGRRFLLYERGRTTPSRDNSERSRARAPPITSPYRFAFVSGCVFLAVVLPGSALARIFPPTR